MVDASPIPPMQPTSAADYRTQAYEASNSASSLQTSAPSMLQELKQNLVGIFAKDNPVIDARNTALQDYLGTASQSRADMLPGNLPATEGRQLALSPTQQNAVTSSRLAASLAPLAGYNEILKGMYGNIGDLVQGAGGIYENTLNAEQTRASNLMKLYELAASEEASKRSAAAAGGGGIDIAAILAALTGGDQGMTPGGSIDDFFGAGGGQEQPGNTPIDKINAALSNTGQSIQQSGIKGTFVDPLISNIQANPLQYAGRAIGYTANPLAQGAGDIAAYIGPKAATYLTPRLKQLYYGSQ